MATLVETMYATREKPCHGCEGGTYIRGCSASCRAGFERGVGTNLYPVPGEE